MPTTATTQPRMGYRTRACIAILAVVGLLAFQHTTVMLEELTTISFLPPWPLFTAATAGLTLTERSFAAVAPPGAQILRLATAYVSSASLTASVQLGVWDALAAALPHPLSSRHLAAAIAVPDHIALAKLMTLLAQHGMVERIPGDGSGEDDAWALNHVSRLLVSSHPSSLAPAVALLGGPEHTAPMHDLAAVMRRGAAPGGFAGSHAGKSLWEYLAERPERERVFDDAMQAIEATEKGAVLADGGLGVYDVVVDVGSGRGGAGRGIGPSVARFDQTHFSKAEIEHGARRLADVLAQLRAHQHDDGFVRVSRAHGRPLPAPYWQTLRNRALR